MGKFISLLKMESQWYLPYNTQLLLFFKYLLLSESPQWEVLPQQGLFPLSLE